MVKSGTSKAEHFQGVSLPGKPLPEQWKENAGFGRLPFRSRLSFEPLLEHLKAHIGELGELGHTIIQEIEHRLDATPVFKGAIENLEDLEEHQELLDFLINTVVPPAHRNHQLAKLSLPFHMGAFYETPVLKQLTRAGKVSYMVNRSANLIYCATVVGACSLILNEFYGQNIQVDPPFSIAIKQDESKLGKHYKVNLNTKFVNIKKLKPLRPLSQEQINNLLSNIYDTEAWLNHLPPDAFEFEGFVLSTLIDITEEEALSQLKQHLLKKDAIVNRENITELEAMVQSYLNISELQLGVTAVDYPIENVVSHKYKIRFDFLAEEIPHLMNPQFQGSIYDKACRYKEVVLVEDLNNIGAQTEIEEKLIEKGLGSIIVAPLFNKDDQVIGLLEVACHRPYALHAFSELKFRDLIGLFSLAVERSRLEIDNQVEAIIREQFTDVHPSLEWKFVEASYNLLEKREEKATSAVIDPIVFKDVFPLYGQADIVGSSSKRNAVIQADLVDNLLRVGRIMDQCAMNVTFPLLRQYKMRVDRHLKDLEKDFNSNDESIIVDLLHNEIHPVLEHFRKKYPELRGAISTYFGYLDDELRIVYRKRKEYEDSVTMLNNMISGYLEETERESQKVLPHYFTKYKTDGIEWELYLGQSILRNEKFCEMHLKNFRLWQLIHLCEITRRVDAFQSELPVPLITAQMAFAYTTSLSIRFREDEKQFDVDGAYNVRYEILKKRIDKALIEGTDERLTQAGKIAIVYLQEKDRLEYLDYLEYLKHDGYITDEIEDLKLGKLQGVQGLRALRVSVKI